MPYIVYNQTTDRCNPVLHLCQIQNKKLERRSDSPGARYKIISESKSQPAFGQLFLAPGQFWCLLQEQFFLSGPHTSLLSSTLSHMIFLMTRTYEISAHHHDANIEMYAIFDL